jgi:hypothetical protein
LLDAIPSNVCCRILIGQKIQVLFSNLHLASRGRDIGILAVLGIQGSKLPARWLLAFRVFEVGDLTEYSNLLDEALERLGMDREAGAVLGSFKTCGFVLL